MQLGDRPGDLPGPRRGELFAAAVAPQHADRGDALGRGPFDVIAAVADHHRGRRILHAQRVKYVADDVALRRARAVHCGASDECEAVGQMEVFGDLPREGFGLRRRHGEHAACGLQLREQLRNPLVEAVLEDAPRGEVFACQGHGPRGLFVVHAVEVAERLLERRPDEAAERAQVVDLDAEAAQGVLYRARDTEHRVGERAVQIEEQVAPAHRRYRFRWMNE